MSSTGVLSGQIVATSAVGKVPAKQIIPKSSEQELRFTELKSNLQGPGGLIYLSDLKEFVYTWPEHTLARLWLIRSLVQTGDVDEAVTLLGDRGIWVESDWQVGFWKANVHILAGELEIARSGIDWTSMTQSKNADVWVQQAVLEQESGNHGGAIQLLRIAIKLNPEHALAYLNLGYSLEHSSLPSEALIAYQNFLTSDTTHLYHLRKPVMEHIGSLARLAHPDQNRLSSSLKNIAKRAPVSVVNVDEAMPQ